MRLKVPNLQEVGLQTDDLLDGQLQAGEVLPFLIVERLIPENVHRHAAQSQGGELHGFAGRVNIAQLGLREAVFGA